MNSKITTNSQLSTTESKKQQQTKKTTRTGTESQIQRPYGMLSAGRGKEENGGKGTGIKKHSWQLQNRQGNVKDSIGNEEAKECILMTHGHKLRQGVIAGGRRHTEQGGAKGKKIGTIVIA